MTFSKNRKKKKPVGLKVMIVRKEVEWKLYNDMSPDFSKKV